MSEDQSGEGQDAGRLFVCAFCRTRFRLPKEELVSIRYVGRVPEVECPECAARRGAHPDATDECSDNSSAMD